MSNMSYCKFQNTVRDLQDCYNSLDNSDLSLDEKYARNALIELCKKIVSDAENLDFEDKFLT